MEHESNINTFMMPAAAPMCSSLMHECMRFAREMDGDNQLNLHSFEVVCIAFGLGLGGYKAFRNLHIRCLIRGLVTRHASSH